MKGIYSDKYFESYWNRLAWYTKKAWLSVADLPRELSKKQYNELPQYVQDTLYHIITGVKHSEKLAQKEHNQAVEESAERFSKESERTWREGKK